MDGVQEVVGHVLHVGTKQCCISVISLHELFYGAHLAKERKEEYFEKELKKKGKPIDEFDMVIASHAVNEGLTVVTDNIKHFENMPDVKVVNWTEQDTSLKPIL